MESITIISATNRQGSSTEKVAKHYFKTLTDKGIKSNILSLTSLPDAFISSDMYGKRSPEFQTLIDTYIEHQTYFIFVVPEYNGSFAGILKVFLDAISPKFWLNNKACLVGVASGRAGNIMGLSQLTTILNHLKLNVYHNKLPISIIDKLVDTDGNVIDEATQNAINAQLEGFLKF